MLNSSIISCMMRCNMLEQGRKMVVLYTNFSQPMQPKFNLHLGAANMDMLGWSSLLPLMLSCLLIALPEAPPLDPHNPLDATATQISAADQIHIEQWRRYH